MIINILFSRFRIGTGISVLLMRGLLIFGHTSGYVERLDGQTLHDNGRKCLKCAQYSPKDFFEFFPFFEDLPRRHCFLSRFSSQGRLKEPTVTFQYTNTCTGCARCETVVEPNEAETTPTVNRIPAVAGSRTWWQSVIPRQKGIWIC